jgi:putative acetyltransferase
MEALVIRGIVLHSPRSTYTQSKQGGRLLIVRSESNGDRDSIEQLLIAAFANHPYSHQTEHFIVNALRAAGAMTISLVAEMDGKVVGHIAFSPIQIDGAQCKWLGVGPLAVLPEHQRHGIGKALVDAGLKALRESGFEGCVLVGDPNYYRQFGFAQIPGLVLDGVPAENFMGLCLGGAAPQGHVAFHTAFSATA